MKGKVSQFLISPSMTALLFALLIISIFIPVKYPITEEYSYFLGEKKDFLILFAYISDILLICFVSVSTKSAYIRGKMAYWFARASFLGKVLVVGFPVLLFASYYLNFPNYLIPIISTYFLLLITKSIVLHGTIRLVKVDLYKIFQNVFLVLVVFQSALAVYQFSQQHDLGIQLVGESIIGPYVWGAAKVEALGQVFVRSYGTFPHPNILAGVLALALPLCIRQLLVSTDGIYFRVIKWFILFLTLLTIFLTFSRAAWIAGTIVILSTFVFTWNIAKRIGYKAFLAPYLLSGLFIMVISFCLLPLIQERGNVFDKAYNERKSYNTAALEMVRESPVVGLGPGVSLIHMEQYLGLGNVYPWEVQPIHNYYLLLAAELGIPILILFFIYIYKNIQNSIILIKNYQSSDKLPFLLAGLVGCLCLMLFDHYFYTFQSTVLIFWIWLGLLAREVAHETNSAS